VGGGETTRGRARSRCLCLNQESDENFRRRGVNPQVQGKNTKADLSSSKVVPGKLPRDGSHRHYVAGNPGRDLSLESDRKKESSRKGGSSRTQFTAEEGRGVLDRGSRFEGRQTRRPVQLHERP